MCYCIAKLIKNIKTYKFICIFVKLNYKTMNNIPKYIRLRDNTFKNLKSIIDYIENKEYLKIENINKRTEMLDDINLIWETQYCVNSFVNKNWITDKIKNPT